MSTEIKAVTHTEKVVAGQVDAVTHLEKVIAKYGGGGGSGGFTPTTAQLDAMNSGINSTKVAQITTNENNILLKANTSDVNTTTANLQAQIDQLITPTTQDAEVQNARVDANGKTYATLKEREDADYNTSMAAITEVNSGLIELANNQIIAKEYTLEYGSIYQNGVEVADTTPSTTMRTVEYLSVAEAIAENAILSTVDNVTVQICYYNASKTFVERIAVTSGFEFDDDYSFFRLTFYRGSASGGSNPAVFKSALKWDNDSLDKRFKGVEGAVDDVDAKVDTMSDLLFTESEASMPVTEITGIEAHLGNNCSTVSAGINVQEMVGYDSYYFIADEDMQLWFGSVPSTAYVAILHGDNYTGKSTHSSYFTLQCSNPVRLRNTDNNLPTENNKLTVTAGDVVAFTFTAGQVFPIYGYKKSKKLLVKSIYSGYYSLVNSVLTIRMNNAQYTFKRCTDANIRLDTWRLYKGELIKADNSMFTMWEGSDAEGVVQINGEDDFIGGYHGDETMTDIKIFIDGIAITTTDTINETPFNSISIYVTSNVYHCATSEQSAEIAFVRNKYLKFENNSLIVGNNWVAQDDLTLISAPLSLFQCYYKKQNEPVATNYSVNSDFMLYGLATPDIYPANDVNMTEFKLETKYSSVGFSVKKSSNQKPMGVIANTFISSQNRIKYYYYAIYGKQAISSGEKLYSEFEIKI